MFYVENTRWVVTWLSYLVSCPNCATYRSSCLTLRLIFRLSWPSHPTNCANSDSSWKATATLLPYLPTCITLEGLDLFGITWGPVAHWSLGGVGITIACLCWGCNKGGECKNQSSDRSMRCHTYRHQQLTSYDTVCECRGRRIRSSSSHQYNNNEAGETPGRYVRLMSCRYIFWHLMSLDSGARLNIITSSMSQRTARRSACLGPLNP